jgi:hypothetical protein
MIRSGVFSKTLGGASMAAAPLAVVPANDGGAAAQYGDNDLNSFAIAAIRVHNISNEYSHKMAEALTDPEKDRIERQAATEMVKAVHDEGLTIDTYQAIVLSIEADPDFAERVKERIDQVE